MIININDIEYWNTEFERHIAIVAVNKKKAFMTIASIRYQIMLDSKIVTNLNTFEWIKNTNGSKKVFVILNNLLEVKLIDFITLLHICRENPNIHIITTYDRHSEFSLYGVFREIYL